MAMEFDKANRLYRWSCDGDGCHKNVESDERFFKEGWAAAKAEGWLALAQYPGGVIEWEHYCPKCAEEL
jgi:hypothetical protein